MTAQPRRLGSSVKHRTIDHEVKGLGQSRPLSHAEGMLTRLGRLQSQRPLRGTPAGRSFGRPSSASGSGR